jgi:hypothetical protein
MELPFFVLCGAGDTEVSTYLIYLKGSQIKPNE